MIRGLYTAGSGMLTSGRAIDLIGNNIANSATAGYKSDRLMTTTFGERLTYQIGLENRQIGSMSSGVAADQVSTSFTQGAISETGNPLDLAIAGDGFFAVETSDGETMLTRNGQFLVDQEGYLTDAAGNRVLGEKGTIRMETADIQVDTSGRIYMGGEYRDTLKIISPKDSVGVTKAGEGLFSFDDGAEQNDFTGQILQGCTESSNVDMVTEMSEMMVRSRSFQSCSKIVQMTDEILEKTVNEIGRV